jgi:hypothetical protein
MVSPAGPFGEAARLPSVSCQQVRLRLSRREAVHWLDLVSLRLTRFAEVDLPVTSSDRTVWRFAQERGMILLTGNRNMDDDDSLESTIREENCPDSLPVPYYRQREPLQQAIRDADGPPSDYSFFSVSTGFPHSGQ